jgi:hypothetical protein
MTVLVDCIAGMSLSQCPAPPHRWSRCWDYDYRNKLVREELDDDKPFSILKGNGL